MGHLNKLFEEYDEKGFTIISASGESKDTVQAFVDQLGATYPIFAQTGGGLNAYSTGGVPSACLISAEGKIVWAGHPAALSEDQIDAELKSIDKDRRISTWAFNLTRTMPEVPESLDKDAKNLMKGKFGATLKSVEKAVEKLEGDAAIDDAGIEGLSVVSIGIVDRAPLTLLAGVGYRTNLEGLRQLGELAGEDVEILWFDMPHFKGPSDVFHLMSCLSPLDHDLAVVYPPLMAVRQLEFLQSRGITFVEVPQEEFDTMGCNVLALGPRHAMMVEGNPETERRMRDAGVKVEVIKGYDICRKGEGGPTCMTRPLVRG